MSLFLVWFALPLFMFVVLSLCVQATRHHQHTFKQHVRYSCDDCNFAPRQVRDFYVTSAEGEQMVHDFYTELDVSLVELPDYAIQKADIQDPLALLHCLYAQPVLWEQLDQMLQEEEEEGEPTEACATSSLMRNDALLSSWLYTMTHTFTVFVQTSLCDVNVLKQERETADMLFKCFELHDMLVYFSKLYTHTLCPLTHTKLRATILQYLLRLTSRDGYMPGFLVFAHLRPDMVNEHCYPKINNETEVYNSVSLEEVEEFEQLRYLADKYEEYVIL